MTKERIREYTLRITNASAVGIITILYDLAAEYMEEAEKAIESGDHEEARTYCTKSGRVLGDLIASLDFSYAISFPLFRIYEFISKEVSTALIKNDAGHLKDAKRLMLSLKEPFEELAGKDDNGPVMSNAQTVYAGLTYGKGTLNESTSDPSGNRGYTV